MAQKTKTLGWVCLSLWAVLIIAGIIGKRVFGLPDLVVFFHVPAAVMLVMSCYMLSGDVRRRYQEACRQSYKAMMSSTSRNLRGTEEESRTSSPILRNR